MESEADGLTGIVAQADGAGIPVALVVTGLVDKDGGEVAGVGVADGGDANLIVGLHTLPVAHGDVVFQDVVVGVGRQGNHRGDGPLVGVDVVAVVSEEAEGIVIATVGGNLEAAIHAVGHKEAPAVGVAVEALEPGHGGDGLGAVVDIDHDGVGTRSGTVGGGGDNGVVANGGEGVGQRGRGLALGVAVDGPGKGAGAVGGEGGGGVDLDRPRTVDSHLGSLGTTHADVVDVEVEHVGALVAEGDEDGLAGIVGQADGLLHPAVGGGAVEGNGGEVAHLAARGGDVNSVGLGRIVGILASFEPRDVELRGIGGEGEGGENHPVVAVEGNLVVIVVGG